jgi:hypothetical protein
MRRFDWERPFQLGVSGGDVEGGRVALQAGSSHNSAADGGDGLGGGGLRPQQEPEPDQATGGQQQGARDDDTTRPLDFEAQVCVRILSSDSRVVEVFQ